jgi:hypothetical protein
MKDIKEFYSKIADRDGRNEVVNSLRSMLNSQGWKIMEVLLKDKERSLQEKVNDISLSNEEDLIRARIELFYLRQFMSKPSNVAESLANSEDAEDTEHIYE